MLSGTNDGYAAVPEWLMFGTDGGYSAGTRMELLRKAASWSSLGKSASFGGLGFAVKGLRFRVKGLGFKYCHWSVRTRAVVLRDVGYGATRWGYAACACGTDIAYGATAVERAGTERWRRCALSRGPDLARAQRRVAVGAQPGTVQLRYCLRAVCCYGMLLRARYEVPGTERVYAATQKRRSLADIPPEVAESTAFRDSSEISSGSGTISELAPHVMLGTGTEPAHGAMGLRACYAMPGAETARFRRPTESGGVRFQPKRTVPLEKSGPKSYMRGMIAGTFLPSPI
eukprot:2480470-Rhodomonas_salina.2